MKWDMRRVVSVDLSNNPRAREALPLLVDLPHLHSLNLRQTAVGDGDLKHIVAVSSLAVLDLSNSQVTDDGLRTLKPLTSLRWLKLGGSQCTPQGVTCLGAPNRLTTDFQLGTAINWARSFGEAAMLAKHEHKLLFVIHVSGDFNVPEDT